MLKHARGAALILFLGPFTAFAQPAATLPIAYFSPQRAFAASLRRRART